ncbi:MAG: TIGR00730 family Rossman fold protein [Campylobacteraceae bacterium]|nr:TIGR00730 family Rossman fold protein [Campylobacteraceae bacterium]
MKFENMINDIEKMRINSSDPNRCVTIFGSARFEDTHEHCYEAYTLAKRLALKNYIIVTGGGGGIMKAANKGAFDAKQSNVGINVILPNEQRINEFVTEGTVFSNLALRKVALIEKSKYFVIFPGGYGTLDELFELLVLVQNGLYDAKVFLYGTKFYAPLVEFLENSLLAEGTISKKDLEIYTLTDDIEFIYNEILKGI